MLPHDIEAEEAVLAALMVSPEAMHEVAGRLTVRDFYVETNGWIFAVCMDMYAKGEGVNTVTVAHYLAERKQLEDVGGMSELMRMVAMLPIAEGAPFYAGIVREMATKRSLISVANSMNDLALGSVSAEQIVGKAELMLHEIRQRRAIGSTTLGPGGKPEMWQGVREFLDAPGRIKGLRTGWDRIDRTLNGLVPGRLITAGAATAVGKSLFVQNVMRQLAIQDIPSLVFTTEMTAREVRERLVFMEAGVDRLSLVRKDYATDYEKSLVLEAMGAVRGWPIWYCEEAHPTAATIRSEVRRAKELHGIQAVFVDHLGYVEGRGESERDRLTDSVATLKGIAQDEDLPVVATSHVNRAGAGSGDWLKLTDLHGASAIEKDSDQVILMTPCIAQVDGQMAPMTPAELRAAKDNGLFTIGFELAKNRHGGYALEYMHVDWSRQGGRFVVAA